MNPAVIPENIICCICSVSVKYVDLESHLAVVHFNSDPYQCDQCDYDFNNPPSRFPTEAAVKKHMREKHGTSDFSYRVWSNPEIDRARDDISKCVTQSVQNTLRLPETRVVSGMTVNTANILAAPPVPVIRNDNSTTYQLPTTYEMPQSRKRASTSAVTNIMAHGAAPSVILNGKSTISQLPATYEMLQNRNAAVQTPISAQPAESTRPKLITVTRTPTYQFNTTYEMPQSNIVVVRTPISYPESVRPASASHSTNSAVEVVTLESDEELDVKPDDLRRSEFSQSDNSFPQLIPTKQTGTTYEKPQSCNAVIQTPISAPPHESAKRKLVTVTRAGNTTTYQLPATYEMLQSRNTVVQTPISLHPPESAKRKFVSVSGLDNTTTYKAGNAYEIVQSKSLVLPNDVLLDVLKCMRRKGLAKIQDTAQLINDIIKRDFASKPLHIFDHTACLRICRNEKNAILVGFWVNNRKCFVPRIIAGELLDCPNAGLTQCWHYYPIEEMRPFVANYLRYARVHIEFHNVDNDLPPYALEQISFLESISHIWTGQTLSIMDFIQYSIANNLKGVLGSSAILQCNSLKLWKDDEDEEETRSGIITDFQQSSQLYALPTIYFKCPILKNDILRLIRHKAAYPQSDTTLVLYGGYIEEGHNDWLYTTLDALDKIKEEFLKSSAPCRLRVIIEIYFMDFNASLVHYDFLASSQTERFQFSLKNNDTKEVLQLKQITKQEAKEKFNVVLYDHREGLDWYWKNTFTEGTHGKALILERFTV